MRLSIIETKSKLREVPQAHVVASCHALIREKDRMNKARTFSKICSTKANVARNIIIAVVTIAFSMQMVACGRAPKQSEMQASCGYPVWNSDQDASSIMTAMFEYQKNPGLRCALVVPANRYTVVAYVEWSNGWTENVWLTDDLKMEPGQRYIILAQEKDGYSPPITDVKLGGYTSNAAKAVMYPLVAPIFAVHLPYYLASLFLDDANGHIPKRPSKDCYIWIENGSTGEVLAGQPPRST